jgi:hypothetical protein
MIILAAWHRRAVAFVAAALALFGAQAALAQSGAWAPNEDDAILLQMQVRKYRMANDLRGYQTPSGVCVDLADVIQSLDLPIRVDKKSRRATGWIFSEDQTFTLDRDSNTVQIMNNRHVLQPGELYDSPQGWCVGTRVLGSWLGVRLTASLRNSVLILDSDKPLPFIEAIERKSRAARLSDDRPRDLSAYSQAHQPYAMWRLPSVDVVAQADVRSSGGRTEVSRRYEVFASGEAAFASYDMRLASDQQGVPQSLRIRAYRNDPDGHLLGPLEATQVAVGDVELLPGNVAGASSVGRGVFVSNRPLQRASRFGSTVLRGTLPLGWDAELYRNGQLLAFQGQGQDGRYEFDVQLVYGQNELEVVLYGPQGQVRREKQLIPVGYGAVAPGKLEYWAGVVERNHDLINFSRPPPTGPPDSGWHYAAGAQYGIDRRTVVGASGHSLVLAGRRRSYAELDLQRAVGPMLLGLSAAQELAGGRVYRADLLGKLGKINVQAESYYVDGDFVSGVVSDRMRSEAHVSFDTVLKAGKLLLPVSGSYRRSETRDGQVVNEVLARGGVILPHLALTAYVLDRRTSGFGGPQDGTFLGLLANTHIASFTVRGEGSYRVGGARPGLENASLTLERPLDDDSNLRLDVQHDTATRVTEFELGYVRQFKKLALRASGRVDNRGSLGASLGLAFSFGRDPLANSWRMSSEKLAERGEAAVSVFLDEDGDGHRSRGEKPLEGVGITAGSSGVSEPTDKDGHAFVQGLQPYERVLVSVDESSLPDPFLVMRGRGVVVTPRPGVASVVELAVAPTGEVEGTLLAPEGTGIGGVELELISADGMAVAKTRSEYDGYFLFEKVVYGKYALRVSADSEKAIGAQGELSRNIELNGQKTTAKVGTVKVRAPTSVALAGGSP